MTKIKKIIFVCTTIVVLLVSTCLAPLAYTYDKNTGVTPDELILDLYPVGSDGDFRRQFQTVGARSQILLLFELYKPDRPLDQPPNWTLGYYNTPNYTVHGVYTPLSAPITDLFSHIFDFNVYVTPLTDNKYTVIIEAVNWNPNVDSGDYQYLTVRVKQYPTPNGYNDIIKHYGGVIDNYADLINQADTTIQDLSNQLDTAIDEKVYYQERYNDIADENETLKNGNLALQELVENLENQLDQGNWLFRMFDGFGSAITNFISIVGQWSVGGVTLMSVFVVAVVAIVLYIVIKVVRA